QVSVSRPPGDAGAHASRLDPLLEERHDEPVPLLPPAVEGADVVAGLGPQAVDRDASGGHTSSSDDGGRSRFALGARDVAFRPDLVGQPPSTRQARVAAWRLNRASTSPRSKPLTSRIRWRR